jgi:hypothetical protein
MQNKGIGPEIFKNRLSYYTWVGVGTFKTICQGSPDMRDGVALLLQQLLLRLLSFEALHFEDGAFHLLMPFDPEITG